MKKIITGLLIAIGLTLSVPAFAAPTTTFERNLFPETTNLYDLGSLSYVWQNIFVQNAIVGTILATSITSTNGSFINLKVGGQDVCLVDGTNCPSSSSSSSNLQQVTNVGNITTNSIIFAGGTSTAGFITTDVTSTNLNVTGLTNLGNTTITNVTSTNGFFTGLTASNFTATNATSTNLRVSGITSLATTTMSNGTSTNFFTTNFNSTNATSTNLNISGITNLGNTTITNVTTTNLRVSGVTSLASLTFTNATGTNLSLTNPLPATSGGTGRNSYSQGDLIFSSAANTLTVLNKNTSASRYLSNTGASNNPAWAQINLANGITGVTPIANGGTNNSSAYTAGSVIFSDGTSLIQDNSGLFWDDNNNRLGINTTSPLKSLDISGTGLESLINANSTITELSTTTGGGEVPSSIDVQGNFAYVGYGQDTWFSVFDVSIPNKPVLISTTSNSGRTYHLEVHGSYAYLANNTQNRLEIWDISQPKTPNMVGSINGLTAAYGITVAGKYAYVTQNGTKLDVIDISVPTAPILVTSSVIGAGNNPTFSDIDVKNGLAYIANVTSSSLMIVDIKNPNSPSLISELTIARNAYAVKVAGRYAYVGGLKSDFTAGQLTVVDVTTPASPTTTAAINFGSNGLNYLDLAGRYLAGSDQFGKVYIFDLKNPAAPTTMITKSIAPIGFAQPDAVAFNGKYLYVLDAATFPAGSHAFDVLELPGAEVSDLLAHSAQIGALQVANNLAVDGSVSVGEGLVVGLPGIKSDGPLSVSATNTPSYFGGAVTFADHVNSTGTPPTLSSCGTSPTIAGNDVDGYVTVGSVSASGCTITFAKTYTNRPACTVTNESMSVVNAMTYTVSNTAITVSQTGLTGNVLDYHCHGVTEPN